MPDYVSVSQFAAALATEGPPPGGGSIAALSALLAVALLEGLFRLSAKSLYPAQQEKMTQLRTILGELVERDAVVLEKLLHAGANLQEAALTAAQVPLVTAEACLDLLTICEVVGDAVPQHAAGDFAIVIFQAAAGLKGALSGVLMNLPLLQEESVKKSLANQAIYISSQGDKVMERLQTRFFLKEPYSLLYSK
jgi:formiminotetrahydrofolate cyclodeaminase